MVWKGYMHRNIWRPEEDIRSSREGIESVVSYFCWASTRKQMFILLTTDPFLQPPKEKTSNHLLEVEISLYVPSCGLMKDCKRKVIDLHLT